MHPPMRDDLRITFVGHASVAIELVGVRILTDPVLTTRLKHLRRVRALPADLDPSGVDVVAISHQHHDHLHVPSLKLLPADAHVVVPRGLGARLERLGFDRVTELTAGDTAHHDAIRITAVPAAHDDRRHPGVGRITPLGYVFDAPGVGGRSVYFPGDTALYADMASFTPEVALVPVWGWGPTLGGGHLDPEGAADALGLLGSHLAIPIHWGTLWPYHVRPSDRLVLPPRELATAVAARGIGTDVVEVAPGGSVTVG